MLKFDNPHLEALRQVLLGNEIHSKNFGIPAVPCQTTPENIRYYELYLKEAEEALKLAKLTLSLARIANHLGAKIVETPD